MNGFEDAARVALTILAAVGGLALIGGLGLPVIAWLSYRKDGGKDGLLKWISEL